MRYIIYLFYYIFSSRETRRKLMPLRGEFTAYKVAYAPSPGRNVIVTLKVPAHAKRVQVLKGNDPSYTIDMPYKARASEAYVVSLSNGAKEARPFIQGESHLKYIPGEGESHLKYIPGEIVKSKECEFDYPFDLVDSFDSKYRKCSTGIHFFMTIEQAREHL